MYMPSYRVLANALRLRSGPSTTHTIIGMLYRNNIVQGDDIVGDWIHVTHEDKTGWSHRAYLELESDVPTPPEGDVTYRVDTTSLNLRQGPGTNYATVGSLKKSEFVTGLAVSADGQWAQVRKSNGVTGWASLKYMTKIAIPPPDTNEIQMIVTTDTLNIRSGPSTTYSIEGKANRGDRLIYIKATPDWKWVNIKTSTNKVGWVSSRYVMEQNDLQAPPEDYTKTGFHRAL
jgi:uncharacterized protein YgiM (DUF1202 family)